MAYNVITNDAWTGGVFHSSHQSYVEARDQADRIRGRVEDINEQGEAFNSGYEAADQGEPKEECPYPKGTWDRKNWMAGWQAGQ